MNTTYLCRHLAIPFLLVSGLATATPFIASVNGDITKDKTITINGSLFTSKANPAPLLWWKADSGLTPSPLGRKTMWDGPFNGNISTKIIAPGSHQSVVWDLGKSESAGLAHVNFNSDSLFVYRKSYENFDIRKNFAIRTRVVLKSGTLNPGDTITGATSGATGVIDYIHPDISGGNWTHSLFYKRTSGTVNATAPVDFIAGETMTSSTGATMTDDESQGILRTFNFKTFRIWYKLGNDNDIVFSAQGTDNDPTFKITPERTDATLWGRKMLHPLSQLAKQWKVEEIQYKASSINAINGTFNVYQNGVLGSAKKFKMRTTAYPNRYAMIFQDQVSNGAEPGSVVYYDELYIDDTWHRVIICQGKTWATCGHSSEIQIPTSWNDTQIKVHLNLGGLNPKSLLFLYVFDKNGVPNSNGFPLCTKCPLPLIQQ